MPGFDAGSVFVKLGALFDRGGFSKWDTAIKGAKADSKQSIDAKLGADTSNFDKKLRKVQADRDAFGKTETNAKFGINDKDAVKKIEELESLRQRWIKAKNEAEFKVEAEQAKKAIDAIEEQLLSLKDNDAFKQLAADSLAAGVAFAGLEKEADQLGDSLKRADQSVTAQSGGILSAMIYQKGHFGLPKFGLASMLGLGPEHLLTSAASVIGSAFAGMAGGITLASGALGNFVVGAGSDLLVSKETEKQTKLLTDQYEKLRQTQQQYGKSSQQAQAQQKILNQQIKSLGEDVGPKAAQAEAKLARNVEALSSQFKKTTGTAQAESAGFLEQIVKLASDYTPLIAKFATDNIAIMSKAWKPFFAWLEGPNGVGIITNLEDHFKRNIPYSVNSTSQALELLLKIINEASNKGGGFAQKMSAELTKLNSAKEWPAIKSKVDELINDFHLWAKLITDVGRDIMLMLRQSAGEGQELVKALDQVVVKFGDWEASAQGSKFLKTFFKNRADELFAFLKLLGQMLKLFGSLYQAVQPLVPVITAIVGGVADILQFVVNLGKNNKVINDALVVPMGAFLLALKTAGWSKTIGFIKTLIGQMKLLGDTAVKTAAEEEIAAKAGSSGGGLKIPGSGTGGLKIGGSAAKTAEEDVAKELEGSAGGAGGLSKILSKIPGLSGGGLSKLGPSLLKGGGIAIGGSLLSSIVGSIIGGKTGSDVGAIGSGAATGAGLGSIAGPLGAGIGAAVGGGVAAAIKLISHKSYGKEISDAVMKNFGNKMPENMAKKIEDAVDKAKKLSEKQTGGDVATGVGFKPDPKAQKEANEQWRIAGLTAAQQLEKGWSGYTIHKEPVMLTELKGTLKALPGQSRVAAAQSAIAMAQSFEKEGKLPAGSAQKMLEGVEKRFPGLKKYLGDSAKQASDSFNKNMDIKKSQQQLGTSVKKMSSDVQGLPSALKRAGGDTQHQAQTMIKYLNNIDTQGSKKMAKNVQSHLLDVDQALIKTEGRTDKTSKDLVNSLLRISDKGTKPMQNQAQKDLVDFGNQLNKTDNRTQNQTNDMVKALLTVATKGSGPARKQANNDLQKIEDKLNDTKAGTQNNSKKIIQALINVSQNGSGPMRKRATQDLNQLRSNTVDNLTKMASTAVSKTKQMANSATTNTNTLREKVSGNMTKAQTIAATNMAGLQKAVFNAMSNGVLSTGKGMQLIIDNLNKALKEMGQKQLSSIQVAVMSQSINNAAQLKAGQNPAGGFRAGGGLLQIGNPGERGPDNIPMNVGGTPIVVGAGEQVAVFNRHQQALMDMRLQDYGGLEGMFSTVNKPHYAARGGLIKGRRYAAGGNVWQVRASAEESASGDGWTELSTNGNAAAASGHARTATGDGGWDFATLGRTYPHGTMLNIKSTATGRKGTFPLTDVGDGSSFAPAIGLTPAVQGALGGMPSTVDIQMADGSNIALASGFGQLVSGKDIGGGGVGGSSWTDLNAPKVKGSGVMATIANAVIKKANDAANKYGQEHAPVTTTTGAGAGTFTFQDFKGPLPVTIQKALQVATYEVGRHIPYGFEGRYGINAPEMDCSGFVSTVLNAAGINPAGPMVTGGLKTWGVEGPGKYLTVGVWGADSGPEGHTMMEIANRYFESGGGGGGPHEDAGWSQSFPWKRHWPGLAKGGMVKESQKQRSTVGSKDYQPTTEQFQRLLQKYGKPVNDPRQLGNPRPMYGSENKARGGFVAPTTPPPPPMPGVTKDISIAGSKPSSARQVSGFNRKFHGRFEMLRNQGVLPRGAKLPRVHIQKTGYLGQTGHSARPFTSFDRVIHIPYSFLDIWGNADDPYQQWADMSVTHEIAHSQQKSSVLDGEVWQREGGAQSWTDVVRPNSSEMDDGYRGYVNRVKRQRGPKWIRHDQFRNLGGFVRRFATGGIAPGKPHPEPPSAAFVKKPGKPRAQDPTSGKPLTQKRQDELARLYLQSQRNKYLKRIKKTPLPKLKAPKAFPGTGVLDNLTDTISGYQSQQSYLTEFNSAGPPLTPIITENDANQTEVVNWGDKTITDPTAITGMLDPQNSNLPTRGIYDRLRQIGPAGNMNPDLELGIENLIVHAMLQQRSIAGQMAKQLVGYRSRTLSNIAKDQGQVEFLKQTLDVKNKMPPSKIDKIFKYLGSFKMSKANGGKYTGTQLPRKSFESVVIQKAKELRNQVALITRNSTLAKSLSKRKKDTDDAIAKDYKKLIDDVSDPKKKNSWFHGKDLLAQAQAILARHRTSALAGVPDKEPKDWIGDKATWQGQRQRELSAIKDEFTYRETALEKAMPKDPTHKIDKVTKTNGTYYVMQPELDAKGKPIKKNGKTVMKRVALTKSELSHSLKDIVAMNQHEAATAIGDVQKADKSTADNFFGTWSKWISGDASYFTKIRNADSGWLSKLEKEIAGNLTTDQGYLSDANTTGQTLQTDYLGKYNPLSFSIKEAQTIDSEPNIPGYLSEISQLMGTKAVQQTDTTGGTGTDDATAAAQQALADLTSFQTDLASLFASFGSNFVPAGQRPNSTTAGMSAGAQFYGALGGTGSADTMIRAMAQGGMLPNGSTTNHYTFNNHFGGGPPDPHTFAAQHRYNLQALVG